MKYRKFEEWMVGKSVTYGSYSGKVVEGCGDGDSLVYVLWEVGSDTHIELIEELDFVEEPENTQVEIVWQVGQEVWCAIYGKGVVETVLEKRNELEVRISGEIYLYDLKGCPFSSKVRTLFFSEPVVKIEGDKYPPKKPFTPTLKKGDKVVIDTGDRSFIATIKEEKEDEVLIERQVSGIRYPKNCIMIYKLGEEVKL